MKESMVRASQLLALWSGILFSVVALSDSLKIPSVFDYSNIIFLNRKIDLGDQKIDVLLFEIDSLRTAGNVRFGTIDSAGGLKIDETLSGSFLRVVDDELKIKIKSRVFRIDNDENFYRVNEDGLSSVIAKMTPLVNEPRFFLQMNVRDFQFYTRNVFFLKLRQSISDPMTGVEGDVLRFDLQDKNSVTLGTMGKYEEWHPSSSQVYEFDLKKSKKKGVATLDFMNFGVFHPKLNQMEFVKMWMFTNPNVGKIKMNRVQAEPVFAFSLDSYVPHFLYRRDKEVESFGDLNEIEISSCQRSLK